MVKKYGIEMDALKHPLMVEEDTYETSGKPLDSPTKIAEFLNASVGLKRKSMYTCLLLILNVIFLEYLK